MSDQLTHAAPLPSAQTARRQWVVPAVQAAVIVVACLGLGAVGGWLWERLWTPAQGLVWQGQWNKGLLWLNTKTFAQGWSENAHQDVYSGLGLYVLVAGCAGIAIGLVAAFLLARHELVTLAALGVGGLGGGILMAHLGVALSPADPTTLAPHTANGVLLPDRLQLMGTTWPVHLRHWHLHFGSWHPAIDFAHFAFPGGALLALAVVFLAFDRRPKAAPVIAVRSEPSPLP